MSEPDFEQIALVCMAVPDDGGGQATIAEQLRLVWNTRGEEASLAVSQAYELGHTTGWNARGAADIAAVESRLSVSPSPSHWLHEAIKALNQ